MEQAVLPAPRNDDFDEFAGLWAAAEEAEFRTAIEQMRRADPADWKLQGRRQPCKSPVRNPVFSRLAAYNRQRKHARIRLRIVLSILHTVHSYPRTTSIAALRVSPWENEGMQAIAANASPQTTRLYSRTSDLLNVKEDVFENGTRTQRTIYG